MGKRKRKGRKGKRPAKTRIDYGRRLWILRGIGFDSYAGYLALPLWAKIRIQVLERDRNRCRLCGKKATQVHHTAYTSENLSGLSLADLAAVCAPCHRAIEFDGEEKRPPEAVGSEYLARRHRMKERKGPSAAPVAGVVYFFRAKAKNNSAHLWTGDDTACRMWSTGGMDRSRRWETSTDPGERRVCKLCLTQSEDLTEEFRAIVRG